MIYKKFLISCAVSTLLFATNNNVDKEYQVNFNGGGGSTDKTPTFSPTDFQSNKDFSWNRRNGEFIVQTHFRTDIFPTPTVTATFKSDTNNYGILTLKSFFYINAPSSGDGSEGKLKVPTKEDADTKRLLSSKLLIANDSSSGFKSFVLSGNGGGEGVSLYSGANLEIQGFSQTVLNGTVNINAGGISKDSNSYGYLNSSLKIVSEKDYSTLAIKSSLNLNTNSGNPRTELRPEANFEANIKGNISIEGYTTIANQAKASFKAGNTLRISSTLSVSAQEMKKITKDQLGNESVLDEDRVKQTNLILKAPKIELSGGIDLGLNAQEIKTREKDTDGIKIIEISQLPSDIGTIVQITADINDKQVNGDTIAKPTDWNEVKKAQFVQTSGGRIGIGMNSEAKIETINNAPSDTKKIFDKDDPYAITFSSVTIQDQKAGNKILNLDAQAKLRKTTQEMRQEAIEIAEGAGKVLFQGKFELGKNANAKIEAYDGFDLHKDSSFALAKDSLVWLHSKKTDFSLTNEGDIQARGGAFLAGDVYRGNGQINATLKNTGKILISDSKRSINDENPGHPNPPIPKEEMQSLYESNSSGVFLLGQKNILDNQGSLIFDGFGNLATMTSGEDKVVRDIEIINSNGKKGIVDVRGSQNTISSSGSIKIASQNISMTSKTVEEGEGENKKSVTYQGELILRSISKDVSSKIVLGNKEPSSGRDRVSVTGGTLRIESLGAGVDSYNLRLVDTTLDLTKLSLYQKDEVNIGGGGAFVNQRRLEFGGNVTVYVSSERGAFANGEYQGKINHFRSDLPIMKVRGDNAIFSPKKKIDSQGKFAFDNNANLELYSNAKFKIGGDFNNNGSVVFKADQFGVGTIFVDEDLIFDMTNHQGGDKTVNPLIAITHSNFYSFSLDHPYILFQSKQIKYRVGNLVIDSSDGTDPSPKPKNNKTEDTLTYAKQQEYLKKEIEDFLNGANAYEGNEDKLGIFLKGVGLVSGDSVGFTLTRSDAIAQIQSNSSLTGVIDQYFDILAKSDGQVSNNKTNVMKTQVSASNPMALKVLNNALESKNSLELEILKDIGSYNTAGLIQTASAIDRSMKTMANIEKPLMEDFQKMQIVREVAVQNRMMRFSNPYIAEIELAQYIKNLSSHYYAQGEIQSDATPSIPSYIVEDSDKTSFKHGFWGSVISSTTKEKGSTSALYGFSIGYEYAPIANVLIGAYFAYGYSDFKESILKNNAHNIDLTAYVRLYYGSSEVDLTLGYMQAFNNMKIENPNPSLSQKLDFGSNAFDFNIKYGYVFKIPKVKGLFIKPQGSYTIYGVNIPDLKGESSASIMYDKQLRGGMIFNLGAELRQYISAYSFLYILPSFEYNLMNQEKGSVYFSGATNKLHYSSNAQAKGLFSLYAGGEGYISPDFSLNLSAGYKAGIDKEEHNISISAGFRYKF